MKKGMTLVEVIVIIGMIGIASAVFLAFIGGGSPNNGQHTGIITSVEQEGIIWKTWRVYVKTSQQSTQEDQYCVTDPTIITQLENYSSSVTEVTVHYSRGFIVPPWKCANEPSIINSVNKS